jgi:hypothetical protein
MAQLDMGGAFDYPAAKDRLFTPHGCGYMFGFADALLQRAGVTDEVKATASLAVLYVRMFGEEQGPKVFRASLDLQSEADVAAGRTAGGGEALQWLTSEGKDGPLGLTDFLNTPSDASPG